MKLASIHWGLLLAVACVSASLQGQSAATSHGYGIAGIVVNTSTGEPVRGATVAALAEEDSRRVASAVTSADGHFSLDNLRAAKYQLTASKRGYATGAYDEHGDFSSAIVTGDDPDSNFDTTHLVFHLTPGALVRGVITADGGDPVPDAQVMLFKKPDSHRPGEKITQQDTADTDDTGAYEFANLSAGEYLIAVKATPWYAMHRNPQSPRQTSGSSPNQALDVAYPITYFDSTIDEASASPILLAGGSRVVADINMHAVPSVRLQVTVPRRPDGQLARPELSQAIFGETVSNVSAGFMDALQSGSTEFAGVAPGQYELTQGDPPRVVELDANTSQQIEPGAGLPATSMSGTLETADGGRFDGSALVTLEPADAGQGLRPLEASFQRGAFHFPAVASGTWKLRAEVNGLPETVLSTTIAGKTQRGNSIAVQDHPITVVVRTTAGGVTVEGFARKEGKGVAGALVLLLPQATSFQTGPAFSEQVRVDQSDSDGSFSLHDVAAGRYIVVAISGGWALDLTHPELLSRYLPGGFPVTVQAAPQKDLRLAEPVMVQVL
jgi:5-hydroxyisourate hydrolase-like protein (transthyretin family)